jgi:hypothetical protein
MAVKTCVLSGLVACALVVGGCGASDDSKGEAAGSPADTSTSSPPTTTPSESLEDFLLTTDEVTDALGGTWGLAEREASDSPLDTADLEPFRDLAVCEEFLALQDSALPNRLQSLRQEFESLELGESAGNLSELILTYSSEQHASDALQARNLGIASDCTDAMFESQWNNEEVPIPSHPSLVPIDGVGEEAWLVVAESGPQGVNARVGSTVVWLSIGFSPEEDLVAAASTALSKVEPLDD